MRRERSQSSDRGRPYVPRWDNPTGQLPGTGIPSGSDSGLHGTSPSVDRLHDHDFAAVLVLGRSSPVSTQRPRQRWSKTEF